MIILIVCVWMMFLMANLLHIMFINCYGNSGGNDADDIVGKDCSNGNIDGGSDSENDNGT